MTHYEGKGAKNYNPLTTGKRDLLFPALLRHLPNKSGKLLDIGCGPADLCLLVQTQGYKYYGLDLSEELLERARTNYSNAHFIHSSATNIPVSDKFDAIVISMLFPALDQYEDIVKTLKEARRVLAAGGTILIGVTHPSFDWYMQKGLWDKKGVATTYTGYFTSGAKFVIQKDAMAFHDHHWTLEDYSRAIKDADLLLDIIDECRPISDDEELVKKKSRFPTYMVFVVKKK